MPSLTKLRLRLQPQLTSYTLQRTTSITCVVIVQLTKLRLATYVQLRTAKKPESVVAPGKSALGQLDLRMQAIVLGATGATGRHVVGLLLQNR